MFFLSLQAVFHWPVKSQQREEQQRRQALAERIIAFLAALWEHGIYDLIIHLWGSQVNNSRQVGTANWHTHTHIQMQVHAKITLNSNKTFLGKHVHHQSPCFVLFRRMTEAAVESADVLIKTCDVTSCDVITCSSPSPCQSLCMQKEDEECRHDCKKLEQQVSDTKYCYCYASH